MKEMKQGTGSEGGRRPSRAGEKYRSKRILIRNPKEIKQIKQILQSSFDFTHLECNHTHIHPTSNIQHLCQAFRPHPHIDILPYEPTTQQHPPPTPSC